MKKILVTGATGFIGIAVSRLLAARGARPRLMVRRPLRGSLVSGLDADLVQADLESEVSLDRAVQGIDTVLHLGARAVFEEYGRLRPTIVDGTRLLVRAAARHGVRRWVQASSLLVYGDQDRPITPSTPAHPRLGYGRAKLEADHILLDATKKAGISLAIVRLPHVYGARDLLFTQVQRGALVFPGAGTNLYAHMHVTDAARILAALTESDWTGVSPVADDLPTTWNEFFQVLRDHYPRLRRIGFPQWLGELAMHVYAPVRRVFKRPSIYTADTIRGWNLNLPVEKGLIWNDLGLRPTYPTIREGIPAALDDSIQYRWRHPVLDAG